MIASFFQQDASLALATDQYQLTMGQAYWKNGLTEVEAEFHMFFRRNPFKGGYVVMAGVEPLLEALRHVRFSAQDLDFLATQKDRSGLPLFEEGYLRHLEALRLNLDIAAAPEGTLVFPHEPIVRVRGPILQAQLVETLLLNTLNFQSLIATKAARVCYAAQGDPVIEFGLRRAQGMDGGLSASRAAYIGGCAGTSNALAGKWYGIPLMGTHAHSWVMLFDREVDAFRAYAQAMPRNCVFLVDTYNTLEGIRHAIEVGHELADQGVDMVGIRLDSGDLAYFSVEARALLDAAGLNKAVVMASNELDEYLIQSLKVQGARIGAWGVGTKLATAQDDPALGGVYKLAAVKKPGQAWEYKLKLSEQTNKISIPGRLNVYRYLDAAGQMMGDALAQEDESPQAIPRMIDPYDALRKKDLTAHTQVEELLVPVWEQGQRVGQAPSLAQARERTRQQMARLHPSHLRFENPHVYPVGISPALHQLRETLIQRIREGKANST